MKKYLLSILIILISSFASQAQDTIINGRNTNLIIAKNVPWIALASQTYVLSPLGPDYGFCVSMINNNPTSSHTFAVTMSQTGDSDVFDFSHNTGRFASLTVVGTPSPIAANTTQTFFVRSNGAAKIAFQFTGGTTQAGSPDTVDIFAVQTTANGCGTVNPQTGQSYTLATPNTGTSSAPPIMAVSDGLAQSFGYQIATSNPVAGNAVAEINPNNGTRSQYIDFFTFDCTAACRVSIVTTSTVGTCTNTSPANLKSGSSITPTGLTGQVCTVEPATVATPFQFDIPANTVFTVDLRGIILPSGTTNGLKVTTNGFTGNIQTNIKFYEK